MGNDGGVIAVQRKFMRHGNTKDGQEKVDKEAVLVKRVTTCSLTDEPLKEPIVADDLGNLYNKAALIERLLERTIPESFGHITSLKDVTNCTLARKEGSNCLFYCPITLVEMNGRQPFALIRSCGCVLSEKAIREIKTPECLVCNQPFQRDQDVLPLVPTEESMIEELREKMRLRKEKRGKKKSKKKRATTGATGNSTDSSKRAKMVSEAAKAVENGKATSSVYSSLFAPKKDKSANDLLMTVAGLRYTLS